MVIATLACLVISILRFGAAFKVADRPPQFFDLRHNLGGLEDITSNYFSEVREESMCGVLLCMATFLKTKGWSRGPLIVPDYL